MLHCSSCAKWDLGYTFLYFYIYRFVMKMVLFLGRSHSGSSCQNRHSNDMICWSDLSLNSLQVAAHVAADRLRLLEGIGSFGVSLTFYVLRKSRDLPCFVGSAIGAVEDFVSPCIEPLATKVGTEGMYLLSIADDKVLWHTLSLWPWP